MTSKVPYDVIVVGAGTTGSAAIYHLANAGATNMLCLEMGTVGRGRVSATGSVETKESLPEGDEETYMPQVSGSNVFNEEKGEGPSAIKMIIVLPPYEMLENFADHHGWKGVKTYLDMATFGRDIEVDIARKVLPNPQKQLRQLGSLMVTTIDQVDRLRQEYKELLEVGCECEWWDEAKVVGVQGYASKFVAGIWFPKDAVIDSSSYARALIDSVVNRGKLVLREGCPAVVDVRTNPDSLAVVTLADGSEIFGKKVIMATGGMFFNQTLAGILKPCWSYLVAQKHREAPPVDSDARTGGGMPGGASGNSPNFFTFGFSHDWCVSNGLIRMSGEDHYSGLKAPRYKERCDRMAEWVYEKYPYLEKQDYPMRYGIYSETPDQTPLVGTPLDSSAICYMVGCNAWGQASMSAVASMAPGLLGYRPMNEAEKQFMSICNIRRFNAKQVAANAVDRPIAKL